MARIDNAAVESEIQVLKQRVDELTASETAIVKNVQDQATQLTTNNPFKMTDMARTVQDTIKTAASTASQFLTYYKVPVPAGLQAITDNPSAAMTVAIDEIRAMETTTTTAAPASR